MFIGSADLLLSAALAHVLGLSSPPRAESQGIVDEIPQESIKLPILAVATPRGMLSL